MLFQKMMGTCLPLLVVTTVAGIPSASMQEMVDASEELDKTGFTCRRSSEVASPADAIVLLQLDLILLVGIFTANPPEIRPLVFYPH